MKKLIIIFFSILIIFSGCSNADTSPNSDDNTDNFQNTQVNTISNNNDEASVSVEAESSNIDEDSIKELTEMLPKYQQYLDTIADSINQTLQELSSKDEYYFENNPEEGIDFLYDVVADYKGYVTVLEDLEYNSNPDIKHINSLFIEGLEENIKVFELTIEALKNNTLNEEEFAKQLEESSKKFAEFGVEYRLVAKKAGYEIEE